MCLSTTFAQFEVDPAIIERARAGELAAFEQIYRRFERPVYTLAWRLLTDAEAARDVLHDAMLKVFQRIGQYRSDAPFWAWLRQIATNEALMRLRREHRCEPEPDADQMVDETAAPWVRADALALERALARLPALTRGVLWLYHVEGYSHPEIADMVGRTVSFSKSQVARGTARLRDLLSPATDHVSCRTQTSRAI
jgi:RNA polymerase sigma factor (sigma-70 family)